MPSPSKPSPSKPGLPEPSERLPRRLRIRRGLEIRSLLRQGCRMRTRHFDVFKNDAPSNHSRFGVIVPKHRHGILERNLLKRRIREVGRRRLLPELTASGEPTDLLVRARRGAYDLSFAEISAELEGAVLDAPAWKKQAWKKQGTGA